MVLITIGMLVDNTPCSQDRNRQLCWSNGVHAIARCIVLLGDDLGTYVAKLIKIAA